MKRKAIVPLRSATLAYVALLSLIFSSEAGKRRTASPEELFHEVMIQAATPVIREDQSFQPVGEHSENAYRAVAIAKQRLAYNIAKRIEALTDDETGARVDDMGFSFTCLVWSTDIPNELQPLFRYGPGLKLPPIFATFAASGAYFQTGCVWRKGAKNDVISPKLGGPCPAGAAVVFETEAAEWQGMRPKVACMIVYFLKKGTQRMMYRTLDKQFYEYLEAIPRLTDVDAPDPVDPTQLVQLISEKAWAAPHWKNTAARFKGFVLVPVLQPEYWHPIDRMSFLSNFVGVAAWYGHVHIVRIAVPVKTDPNRPPGRAILLCIVIWPEKESTNRD